MTNDFFVAMDTAAPPDGSQVLRVGKTLLTGESDLEAYFGTPLSSLESDLLRLAAAVFAVDRAVERGESEDLARSFRIRVPVVNIGRIQPMRTLVEQVLYRLSQDAWSIEFEQISGDLEPTVSKGANKGRTLLFSGGADSLAAAASLGDQELQLVSHRTMNQSTIASQRNLVEYLASQGLAMPHVQVLVSSRSDKQVEHDVEDSQRTRSFVFLVLGALCARRKDLHDIVLLAENGQMAVHLPLTAGRIGALSTHTAHPEVLAGMQMLLSQILNVPLQISNPFLYETKAEVVGRILRTYPSSLWLSNSCWRSARLSKGIHCGECIPCFVRRIAVEIHCEDRTGYARDPWTENVGSLPPDDIARRNLADLTEFVVCFSTMSNEDLIAEWPELLSPEMDAGKVVDMYRRFAGEAKSVLSRYKALEAFLQ